MSDVGCWLRTANSGEDDLNVSIRAGLDFLSIIRIALFRYCEHESPRECTVNYSYDEESPLVCWHLSGVPSLLTQKAYQRAAERFMLVVRDYSAHRSRFVTADGTRQCHPNKRSGKPTQGASGGEVLPTSKIGSA
jgi:hypothetical protein